jgi:hypothetical protein
MANPNHNRQIFPDWDQPFIQGKVVNYQNSQKVETPIYKTATGNYSVGDYSEPIDVKKRRRK